VSGLVETDVARVVLGGEVGNVVYDPTQDRMLVAVQGRNDLAVIDPTTLAITTRVPLPGCEHDHGLAVDPGSRVAFIACDSNATLLTLDLTTGQITGTNTVGEQPDTHHSYYPVPAGANGHPALLEFAPTD